MGRSRSISELQGSGKSTVSYFRSQSCSASSSKSEYVKRNVGDAVANVSQFLEKYKSIQLPPGVSVTLNKQTELTQCPELEELFQPVELGQKLLLIAAILNKMTQDVPYTMVGDSTFLTTFLLRAQSDIRGVIMLIDSRMNTLSYTNNDNTAVDTVKNILAKADLIKLFLTDLLSGYK